MEGQEFLDGISSVDSRIIVAGGVAGSSEFETQHVFSEKGIGSSVVAAAIYSKVLCVNNESCYDWVPIGKEHVITSALGRKIKTIDDINAVEFYKKYTGILDGKNVYNAGTQFPFMVKKNNTYASVPILEFHENDVLVTHEPVTFTCCLLT